MPADILNKIVEEKHRELAQRSGEVPLDEMIERARTGPELRPFVRAIENAIDKGDAAVIAEIKKASPSKGIIRDDFDPIAIAESYERAGATCLSVLTDESFFRGSDEYLRRARAACSKPVLRKDFVIDPYQVYEARAIGADCVLLIVAILEPAELAKLYRIARELGMDVLIEVHDEAELETALSLNPRLLGINNRDLRTFETSLETTLSLGEKVPSNSIVVTESGIHTKEDVALLRARGINAFLVGEAFMRAGDPGTELKKLFG